ncbi:MAG: hypothetical protein Q8Q92_02675 [bacterium]|nr:hypothetical protein [bacterium]
MKKIFIIIIILAVIVVLYTMRDNFSADRDENPAANGDGAFRPDSSNATFIIDDELVTLSAGRDERVITPESTLTEETILLDKFAYGDINKDGKNDTLLLLARYGGGSGTFIYLAAFVSGPINYKGSKAIFIGDRIAPQSISLNGDIVTLEYLDRGPDDAFVVEPTILTTKQFIYKNGEFAEK